MVGGAGSSIQSAHCTVHCTRAGILCSSGLKDHGNGSNSVLRMEGDIQNTVILLLKEFVVTLFSGYWGLFPTAGKVARA
jgi:hypothetical protein